MLCLVLPAPAGLLTWHHCFKECHTFKTFSMKSKIIAAFIALALAAPSALAQDGPHMGPKSRKKASKAIKQVSKGNGHKALKKARKAVDKAEEGK